MEFHNLIKVSSLSSVKKHRSRKKRKSRKGRCRSLGSVPHSSNYSNSNRGSQNYDDKNVLTASHCSWFWQNYHKAMDWQGLHQTAYWRSRALASEYQNNMLFKYIENAQNAVHLSNESSQYLDEEFFEEQKTAGCIPKCPGVISTSSNDNASFVFEVTEEMLSFFEQSAKHKRELFLQREEELRSQELNLLPTTGPHHGRHRICRFAENTILFGDAASSIVKKETTLQLRFQHCIDAKNPKFWPNIPLNF